MTNYSIKVICDLSRGDDFINDVKDTASSGFEVKKINQKQPFCQTQAVTHIRQALAVKPEFHSAAI